MSRGRSSTRTHPDGTPRTAKTTVRKKSSARGPFSSVRTTEDGEGGKEEEEEEVVEEMDDTPRFRLRPKGMPKKNWEKSDDELANPHKYREAEIREMNGASPASTWM